MFQCPNCRAWTDLSAEVDDSMEFDEESAQEDAPDTKPDASSEGNVHSSGEQSQAAVQTNGEAGADDRNLAAIAENLHLGEERSTPIQDAEIPDGANITSKNEGPVSGNSQSANIPIPNGSSSHGTQSNSRSPANHETFEDDPMTPRNDSGPLALDGRAGHL